MHDDLYERRKRFQGDADDDHTSKHYTTIGSLLYYLYLDKYRGRAHPMIQPHAHGRTIGRSR